MLLNAIRVAFILISIVFSGNILAEDSTDVRPPNTDLGKIFLIDQGYINWPGPIVNPSRYVFRQFTTSNGRCPRGTTPYVQMTPTKLRGANDQILIAYGVCAKKIENDGGNYRVTYLAVKALSKYWSGWSKVKVYDQGRDSTTRIYGSKSPTTYTDSDSKQMGYQETAIWRDYAYEDEGGIQWNLFCYPQTYTVPYRQLNQTGTVPECDENSYPYSN